jgi:hypothetical protein
MHIHVFSGIIPQVKICMDNLSTACEGNTIYPALVQAIDTKQKACSQENSPGKASTLCL